MKMTLLLSLVASVILLALENALFGLPFTEWRLWVFNGLLSTTAAYLHYVLRINWPYIMGTPNSRQS